MTHSRRMRRAALRAAVGLVGAGGLGVALAVPASAAPVPANNNLIIMSGSNTTYLMMNALSTLFNESPGCNLTATAGTTQYLDFRCAGNDTGGENGLGDNNTSSLDGAWTTTTSAVTTSDTDIPVSATGIGSSPATGFALDGWGASTVGTTASGGGTLDVWTFGGGSGDLGTYQGYANEEIGQVTCTGGDATDFTGCTVSADIPSGAEISTQYVGGDSQNPYNDVVVQEPPLGSSNGIKQLENTGTDYAIVDAARSSRAPNNGQDLPTGDPVATAASDDPGLNFVAYAQDAVPWIHWTEIDPSKCSTAKGATTAEKEACWTPSEGITSLSIPVLSTIYGASCYEGTGDTCSANTGITNWGQICASVSSKKPTSSTGQYNLCYDYSGAPTGYVTSANNKSGGSGHCVLPTSDKVPYTFAEFQKACPIDVYNAQSGSGTESTWTTVLDVSSTPQDDEGISYRGTAYADSHVIFENEITSILKNGDEADALFYMSYGKSQVACKFADGECGSAKTPKGGVIKTGSETITENGSPIAVDATTIEDGTYPTDRYLYNVYSNGGGSFDASPQAALNFVGEDGFICQESSDVDSNSATGATYGSEIQSTIKSYGFYPLPKETNMYPTQGTLTATPEVLTDPEYQFVDTQYTDGVTATGHCLVFTTNGD